MSHKKEKTMRYFGMIGIAFLTISSGRGIAGTTLTCEKKADLGGNCNSSFSLVRINRFLHQYTFHQYEGFEGNCSEIVKSEIIGQVFHGQDTDDLENKDVYVRFDRTSPNAFLILDFKQPESRMLFKSNECKYNVQ
jgi:hypothetical protein